MAELKIVKIGDPVLRHRAMKVNNFGPELQRLIDDMIDTLSNVAGVGLAAPQVGVGLRVFVAHLDMDPEDETKQDPALGKMHVIVNPEIKRASEVIVEGTEGCLSIPGLVGDVERHYGLVMDYQDRKGQKRRLKLEGWIARVFQHEFDHLNGVLFIDRTDKIYELVDEGDDPDGSPEASTN